MNTILKKIYDFMPIGFKNILASFYGLYNYPVRYGKYYREHLSAFRKQDKFSKQDLDSCQLTMLKKLLKEAMRYSPYYRTKFNEAGLSVSEIESARNLEDIYYKLPILEKSELKRNARSIASTNPARKTCGISYTSGTTGLPLAVEKDRESVQIGFALWRRLHDWMGLPERFRTVRLSGKAVTSGNRTKPPFWVYNFFNRQLVMSIYHLKDDNLIHYIREMNKFKPQLIDGYPSAIYVIAHYLLKHNIEIEFQPIGISTTSETLYEYERRTIEKAFKCKVYNQYASSEGSPWIAECECGSLHMNTDSGIFELVDKEGNPGQPGDVASLIVTSFREWKTPLIRYRIGDCVVVPKETKKCRCGREMPILETIIGNELDMLFTEEKGYVPSADASLHGIEGIKQSQIRQLDPQNVEVLIVKDEDAEKADEALLCSNLKERLGNGINVKIRYVPYIEPGKNGKVKLVKRCFKLDIVGA